MENKVIYFNPKAILELKSKTSIHLLFYLTSIADITGLSNFSPDKRKEFIELTSVNPMTISRSLRELINKGFLNKYSTYVYIVNPDIAYNIVSKSKLKDIKEF